MEEAWKFGNLNLMMQLVLVLKITQELQFHPLPQRGKKVFHCKKKKKNTRKNMQIVMAVFESLYLFIMLYFFFCF